MQVKVIPCKSCKAFFHNMPALSTMNQLVKMGLHVLHEIWNLNFRSSFVYIINNKAAPLCIKANGTALYTLLSTINKIVRLISPSTCRSLHHKHPRRYFVK